MPYTLSFKDRYLRVAESKVVSDTSASQQFYFIPDNEEQLIRTKWTGEQWHKLLSCIETGADLMFPDEANEIIWQFIKTITTPPEAPSDNECFEYLPSASFIKFHPDNPYIDGDNKSGWWREAWFQWEDFFSLFPEFAADWLGGAVGGLVGYQNTDVLCNIASLAYPTWGAFFDAGGVFPKIEIKFSGTGQINVSMLSFPLGGKAIVSLDAEPDILDILTGGILDPASFMIELDRDILSFPPQEYPLIVIPVEVTTGGAHTLYIHFIPTINDETTFLKFGGGIRGVELCGFAEVGEVGIEQIFWDGCALKQIVGGIETTIVTAEEIQDCMDIPSGGGGGAAAIKTSTYDIELGANQDTTSTSMVIAAGTAQNHQWTYGNALIFAECQISNTNAGQNAFFQVRNNGALAANGGIQRVGGNVGEVLYVSGSFTGLDLVNPSTISIYFRANANTARIGQGSRVLYTIIEYADAAALSFLEDIQYTGGGVLQKKLGGIWIDVVDIAALLAPIQSLASSANAAAAAAQTTANNAASVNTAQQTTINNHETRLDSIETLDLPQINLVLADHSSRISALEAAIGANEVWSREYDFQASNGGWTATSAVYVGGQGFRADSGIGFQITKTGTTVFDQRITHVKLEFSAVSGAGVPQDTEAIFHAFGAQGNIRLSNAGFTTNWIKVDTYAQTFVPSIAINSITGQYYLRKITILGRGDNIYFT